MQIAKLKDLPTVRRIAPETIEKHEIEQALRDAAYALDCQLLDLKNEIVVRENKLRQDYLDGVVEITA